ncbi:hypothetical protein CSKR_102756 [Clonorchis sinensis]|uniref:Tetraspanin-CD63 receptor n=2 Tax=Clonorchis sinensis TaxID=79923 RepID=A0A8T1LX49_CLOSI|nr:hypothetical protein CSKR_102756 [Clonorchis sinensis]
MCCAGFDNSQRGSNMLCNFPCRILLIIVNTVSVLVGLVLLAVGALMIWGQDVVHKLINGFLNPLLQSISVAQDAAQVTELIGRILTATSPIGIALFVLGAVFAIVSIIGYCGACCNYKVLLYLYAALVGVLALAVMVCFSVYFAAKDKIADYVVEVFAKSVKEYQSMEANTADSLLIGLLQPPLKCCGVSSSADFVNLASTDSYGGQSYSDLTAPIPCCMMNDKYQITGAGCPAAFTNVNSYINVGCKEPLKSNFIHYMNYVAYGLIGAFVILLLVVLFTILTICIDVV